MKSSVFINSVRMGLCLLIACQSAGLRGDGPADNRADQVRPVPPPGSELSEEVERELRDGAEQLQQQLQGMSHPNPSPEDLRKRAFCEVIPRSLLITLETGMFYSEKDVDDARALLKLGALRMSLLDKGASELQMLGMPNDVGEALDEPNLIAGGFRSRIDGSVQPYGLILPTGWQPGSKQPLRMDVWLHGRGEKVSEVAFLQQRIKQLGEYTSPNTVVLHPYGRYCNAFKFAGEIDVLEAIEHVKQFLPIDDGRIVIRGFSMGGAGCWQLAVHYPNLWAAANPGAGFSETTEFLRVFQQEVIKPTGFQQRLLHWYDCPDWTNNLRQVPTVAYSGEKDRQKQAADVMQAAFESRGMHLPHVIGPDTEHKIHADSKVQIEQFLSEALTTAKPRVPTTVDLTTYSLRYNRMAWLTIDGLAEHWSESRVQGVWNAEENRIELTTQGVTHLSLQFPSGEGAPTTPVGELQIDGQSIPVAGVWDAPQQSLRLSTGNPGGWSIDDSSDFEQVTAMRKRPGLQGPIDDAFMDKFSLVGPQSGREDATVDAWAAAEFQHAGNEWRRHLRGDVPIVDYESGEALGVQQNLVLFGRPSTNRVLASLLDKLPLQWDEEHLVVNGKTYSAKTHVPILIYPNPSTKQHYIVINSGVTYREYAYLNNARQVPMLPDWAVIDVSQGANSQTPGKIVDAGFFDEQWRFKE